MGGGGGGGGTKYATNILAKMEAWIIFGTAPYR